MIKYYDSVYDKAMVTSVQDPDKPKAAGLVLKVFHEVVRTHARDLNGAQMSRDAHTLCRVPAELLR